MVETFIIITEQVEQANKVFSIQRVTLRELSTTNKSTTSYVYLQLGTVFLNPRQLNSTWLLVAPDVDNVILIKQRVIISKRKHAKYILAWSTLGGTRLIGGKIPPERCLDKTLLVRGLGSKAPLKLGAFFVFQNCKLGANCPFLPRDAMLSTVYAVVVCPSVCVCLSHSGIVSKRLNVGSCK